MKNKVKEYRIKYNLSQTELGKILGVSRQTIYSLETGRYNPSLTLAFKIARLFKCKIEEIFIVEDELDDMSDMEIQ